MVIHRREFLRRIAKSALTLSAAPIAVRCAGDPPVRGAIRPNLLFIMADDLGYADLSITGRTDYTTPVIDDFARQGVRLTQAYSAAPVCSPTRVALMTGRYAARLEVGLPFDASDIMPQLRGEAPTERECYWRTFQRTRHKATRHGNWKYLLTEEGEFLFDLGDDPGEARDRKADSPEILARLKPPMPRGSVRCSPRFLSTPTFARRALPLSSQAVFGG